ncbi:head decoration protein [Buttiauxella sp. A111]|uniref:head decoration protein n=1 Tax=Buttiauxella sp. A111 TaxID=2563088 RepID=UPI0010E1E433|nr:head decoration protein [Buttiauxella sp. A111]GDX06646.1 head decoration protein [Buttiauxella sp. A111]
MLLEEFKHDQPGANSDPRYTAVLASGLTEVTAKLTPLMLDTALIDPGTGAAVAWDGKKAGTAVALLAMDVDGTESRITVWKSGTWRIEDIQWPEGVTDIQKYNAFAGSALSVQ